MHRMEFGARQVGRWTRRRLPALVAAAALVALVTRQVTAGTLLVSSTGSTGMILRYNAQNGASAGVFIFPESIGMSSQPDHLLYGKDGNIYVSDYSNNQILRFAGPDPRPEGEPEGEPDFGPVERVFVPPGSGGLSLPTDLAFGPDGNLYVCSRGTDQVLKYNGRSGAFIGAFVTTGSGGLSQPDAMAFGPDGNLYVSGQSNNRVLKYNGTTGAFIGGFTPSSGAGVLNVPVSLRFGPDGNLYVASNGTHNVLKFNGSTGAFISAFASVNFPLDMAFGPDQNLYVADHTVDNVLKFNGSTGAPMGTLVTAGSGGLNVPYSLIFLPPRAPAALDVGTMTGSSVTLSWLDVSDDETNFLVERRTSNSDWTQIATLNPNTMNYTDSGLTAGVPYAYRVVAVNGIGRSVPSNLLPVVTPSPLPPAPGDLHAWPIGAGQVFIGWMPHGGPVQGYAIWRKGGGSDWALLTLLMNPSATGYIDSGLKHDTLYTYRVRALGPNGTSEWSNEAPVLTPVPSLPAPSSLAATVVSSIQVNLTWTLGGTGESAIAVYRKIGSGSFVRIATLAPGSTSYSDTTTVAATGYSYLVRVYNSYYTSPYSNQVNVTTP